MGRSQIRPIVITLVKHFTKLSRSLKNDWEGEVFRYPTGEKHIIDPAEIEAGKKISLPEIPRTRSPPRLVELKARNKTTLQDQPWTLGLVEVMGLLEVIAKQKLDTKNRIAPILLDSNFTDYRRTVELY